MHLYFIFSSFLAGAVALGVVNQRFFKVQSTIAVMFGTIVVSVLVLILQYVNIPVINPDIISFIAKIDFHDLLINGILSFLLFAGALAINCDQFIKDAKVILNLAIIGTAISTILISSITYWLSLLFALNLSLLQCALFGALISPTDPIATIATLKEMRCSLKIRTRIASEALFNDGVGIVIFITLFGMNFSGQEFNLLHFIRLFLQQTGGGIVWGLILGYGYNYCNRHNQEIFISIMLTLIITMWGYTFAQTHGISGPLAIVTAGLIIGKQQKTHSRASYNELINFWVVIEEILNYVLFLIMGLELLNINLNTKYIILGIIIIPIILGSRYISIKIPLSFTKQDKRISEMGLMVWGGLRGGLAIALALSLPENSARNIFITMTYTTVIFSVIVQGLTINRFATKGEEHDQPDAGGQQ